MKYLLLAFVMASVSGCITRGENFPSDITWIKQGETTKDDVRSVLGQPQSVGNSGGSETWTYSFLDGYVWDTGLKELKVYWRGSVVKTFSFSSSFKEDLQKSAQFVPRKATSQGSTRY